MVFGNFEWNKLLLLQEFNIDLVSNFYALHWSLFGKLDFLHLALPPKLLSSCSAHDMISEAFQSIVHVSYIIHCEVCGDPTFLLCYFDWTLPRILYIAQFNGSVGMFTECSNALVHWKIAVIRSASVWEKKVICKVWTIEIVSFVVKYRRIIRIRFSVGEMVDVRICVTGGELDVVKFRRQIIGYRMLPFEVNPNKPRMFLVRWKEHCTSEEWTWSLAERLEWRANHVVPFPFNFQALNGTVQQVSLITI